MVQLKCPETRKPVDIHEVPPDALMGLSYTVTPVRALVAALTIRGLAGTCV